MRAEAIGVQESTGRILCSTIFRAGGKKLLAKGHLINGEDTRMLQTEGMVEVWVTLLEDGEIGEDQAVMELGQAIGCGSIEIRRAAGGRANLFSTEQSCVLVDGELLKLVNRKASVAIATALNYSYAKRGQRVATVKSSPFAIGKTNLDELLSILKENGPILQARPIRTPTVGVLYTDIQNAERARLAFENVMRQRLERVGASVNYVLASLEDEISTTKALEYLLRVNPTLVLIASTTTPAGPGDVVGRAMVGAGCQIERFLAPVVPGNLLLLGYKDDIPILSAPGCFRSAKPNVVDLLLPPMLARYRLSGWEIADMGHGGLLQDVAN